MQTYGSTRGSTIYQRPMEPALSVALSPYRHPMQTCGSGTGPVRREQRGGNGLMVCESQPVDTYTPS